MSENFSFDLFHYSKIRIETFIFEKYTKLYFVFHWLEILSSRSNMLYENFSIHLLYMCPEIDDDEKIFSYERWSKINSLWQMQNHHGIKIMESYKDSMR